MVEFKTINELRQRYADRDGGEIFCHKYDALSEGNSKALCSIANELLPLMKSDGNKIGKMRLFEVACMASSIGKVLKFGGNMWDIKDPYSNASLAVCLEMIFEMEGGNPRKDKPFWKVRYIDKNGAIKTSETEEQGPPQLGDDDTVETSTALPTIDLDEQASGWPNSYRMCRF